MSCSRCITKDSLEGLHPFIETVHAANCPAVEISVAGRASDETYDQNNNVGLFEAGKPTRYNRYVTGSDVFRFKWTLETPV